MYIPVITITKKDIAELEKKYDPPSDKVRIEGNDGNTYIGKLLSWTKRSIKIKLDDGTAMRFRTD
jgi:hypothetical protein